MKRISLLLIFITLCTGLLISQTYRPYTLGLYADGTLIEVANSVKQELTKQGIEILGEYTPANDPNRKVIAFTSPELKVAVEQEGGLTGFAGILRAAITKENDNIVVSYTTPMYWGNAYFREAFPDIMANYSRLSEKLKNAMVSLGGKSNTQFGSKDGKSAKDLRNYKFKILMPHFDDTEKLWEFNSYEEAVASIDENLASGVENIELVYELAFPGQKLKLYGIGMSGEKGESRYISTIDTYSPKHTAYFPYEMLVMGNEVHMLHGRYRIALSFPDTGLGRFMKIKYAPGDIKNMMKTILNPMSN